MNCEVQFCGEVFARAKSVAGCVHKEVCRTEFIAKHRAQNADRIHFAETPSPDFIGSRYRGLAIIGGNPGIAHSNVHRIKDAKMFELQDEIARGNQSAFAELMTFLPKSMSHWPQMVNDDGRRRMQYDIEEVAYVDIVKCGSKPAAGNTENLFRKTGILQRCWTTHTKPLLQLLEPTHVVALWTPIRKVLENLGYKFDGRSVGHYCGARNLTNDLKYATAKPIFDHYYGR